VGLFSPHFVQKNQDERARSGAASSSGFSGVRRATIAAVFAV